MGEVRIEIADGILTVTLADVENRSALGAAILNGPTAPSPRPMPVPRSPRLVTGFWFALGPSSREQMDRYVKSYLAFLGPGVAESLTPTVTTLSAGALQTAGQVALGLT